MSSPYFILKDYTYSCCIQKEPFFAENISAFDLVIQNMSGRKPDFWYYDILQIFFWSCNSSCAVLSKGRSPSYLDTTRYEVLNKAMCCLYK